jgi:hypothetical protein
MTPAPTRTASQGEVRLDDEESAKRKPKRIEEHCIALSVYPKAVGHIAKMHGGSQAHLMRCSDGGVYVVKFPNNPQGNRTLINELICANLAAALNLPTLPNKIIQVDSELIAALRIMSEFERETRLCQSGLCFGSRHPGNRTLIFTRLPLDRLIDVENVLDLAGILLFDLWTSNTDAREVLFFRKADERMMRAHMVDSGQCFKGAEWAFRDACRSTWQPNMHYFSWIDGVSSFEPWLSGIERLNSDTICNAWTAIPPVWYGQDLLALKELLCKLDGRRKTLRQEIELLREDRPHVFPFWRTAPANVVNYAKRNRR